MSVGRHIRGIIRRSTGLWIGFSEMARLKDGTPVFRAPRKSGCPKCAHPLGKPHKEREWDWDGPCSDPANCDHYAWSQALQRLGTLEQAEITIEAALVDGGFPSAVANIGRGSADNLTTVVTLSQDDVDNYRKCAREREVAEHNSFLSDLVAGCDRRLSFGDHCELLSNPLNSYGHGRWESAYAFILWENGDTTNVTDRHFDLLSLRNARIVVEPVVFDVIAPRITTSLSERA